MYSGLKVQARARAPRGFRVVKVTGHVRAEDCETPEEAYHARGNDYADAVAKGAAMSTPSPTQDPLKQYHLQVGF